MVIFLTFSLLITSNGKILENVPTNVSAVSSIELSYSSFLGGNGRDWGYALGLASDGSCYVTGFTESANFPTLYAFNSTYSGVMDAFIAKFDDSGSLLWSTYFGGNDYDCGKSIAISSDGSCYVTGYTASNNFPTLNAYNSTFGGETDVFLSRFSSSGALLWSTYLGGNDSDFVNGIAVTNDGSCYVTGDTESPNFPAFDAYNDTYGGAEDVFVTKISSSGYLIWSTFIGRDDWDSGNCVAVGNDDSCYIAGQTKSENFPTLYAFNSTFGGFHDAFILKLTASGNLLWSTFMGGYDFDGVYGIDVSSDDSCYITGYTESSNFPTLNAYNSTPDNAMLDFDGDAFVSKLSENGVLQWSTFLGGNDDDGGLGLAVDSDGNCIVTGSTGSDNFPTLNAFDDTTDYYMYDAFLTKFSTNGDLLMSTYLGGSIDDDEGFDVAVDDAGNYYVTGIAGSSDFPLKNPYDDTQMNDEVFLTKFSPSTETKPFTVSGVIYLVIGLPMIAIIYRKRGKK